MPSEKQIEAAAKAMETLALERGFAPWDEAASVALTAAEQAEPALATRSGAVKAEAAREALRELATVQMNLSIEDWCRISNTILAALEPAQPAPAAEPVASRRWDTTYPGGQWLYFTGPNQEGEKLYTHPTPSEARLREALANLVQEIDDLISESEGVAGLHLNGDVAEWDDLLPGGPYERLTSLDDARAALKEASE